MSDTNKLNHYLAAWKLSNPQLLAQTMTSHVYTVTHAAETFVLKLLSPSETEEQRAALSLRYFNGHGAVRLLRGWLAFDPKGLVGERTYDCANTLCNPVMPELVHNERRLLTNATILADMLALDLSRVQAFTYAYACLNASWWLQLGGSDIVQWSLNVAEIIEPHIEPLLA